MGRRVWVCGLALALNLSMAVTATRSAAEETPQPPSWFTAGASLGSPVDPRDIEAAINTLREPIDQEQMNKIFLDLARLEDFKERDRLQEMLDERMQEILRPSALPAAQSTIPESLPQVRSGPKAVAVSEEPSHSELLVRIDTLNLGPDATVDDLRARDQLVSAIAGIRDPVMRDELLTRLEERERQSQESAQSP